MPFERRDILFYLADVKEMLLNNPALFNGYAPKDVTDLNLFEVIPMDILKRPRSERHISIVKAINIDVTRAEGAVFCAQKKGMFSREKEVCFYIPEEMLIEGFITECKRRDIMLPRGGKKRTFVEDITIGIRIEKNTAGLELEF